MAIVGAVGLQQVLSLSNFAEKVQQTNQHRPELMQNNFAVALKTEDETKKQEVIPLNKSDESQIREEYTDKGGVKYKNRPRKRKKKKSRDSDEEENLMLAGTNAGLILDVII